MGRPRGWPHRAGGTPEGFKADADVDLGVVVVLAPLRRSLAFVTVDHDGRRKREGDLSGDDWMFEEGVVGADDGDCG
jgi:hypothetical protein